MKLITGGVHIVTTTKLVGTPSQELPFKVLIGTRLKRVDSDIVPVKEYVVDVTAVRVQGSVTEFNVTA